LRSTRKSTLIDFAIRAKYSKKKMPYAQMWDCARKGYVSVRMKRIAGEIYAPPIKFKRAWSFGAATFTSTETSSRGGRQADVVA